MSLNKKKTVIIGGGAAGLLCAGFAVQKGLDVTVLDRNKRPARKLLITGKGRCNVTNACSIDEVLENIPGNPRFLYGALHAFSPQDTMDFFESCGVLLKVERGKRVFPVSDQAKDIVDALVGFAKESGSKIRTEMRVKKILTADGAVSAVLCENGETIPADAVVIATGGRSYPLTGSSGDGYRLAKELGHEITPQRASLVPVCCKEKWCADLMGLSLKNVTLSLKNKQGKVLFSEIGEMLFTHFGVSGPLVLSASAYMREAAGQYTLLIDLKPGLTPEQLDARLLRDFAENKNKDFVNSLGALLPRKLIPVIIRLSGIDPLTKVHSITKQQRRALIDTIKSLRLAPTGFAPIEEAVVTAGGVSVSGISPKTMESKLVSGLYFAGEVIDVDAFTGGFNLQIAFSTGYLAAKSI